MPKYLFKGLDAASTPGPGPTLWFPYLTSFNDVAAQFNVTGAYDFGITLEITLNGIDFRDIAMNIPGNTPGWPFVNPNTNTDIISQAFFSPSSAVGNPRGNPADGGYIHIGPVGMLMGFRLNLNNVGSSTTFTVLLAIDQKE
jgi:hypothetical protein